MDDKIASSVIDVWIEELRAYSYRELVALIGKVQTRKVKAADGRLYQLEAQVFWDSRKDGDVRVMVAGDDGGLSAYKPLVHDFIMAPDGSYVDE